MPLSVPNVEKFLFCLKLETGGLILGWLCAVGACIGLVFSFLIFGLVVFNYPAFLNATILVDEQHKPALENLKYPITLAAFLAIAYCAFSLFACVQLIRGVNNRSSRQTRPFLILVGVETVLAFLTILQFTWSAVVHAIFGTVVNGYLFICIHSLWEIFRDEAMRGHNRQYREAAMINKV